MKNRRQVFYLVTVSVLLFCLRDAPAQASLPMPASGDYVLDGWTIPLVMVVPANLDGDADLDWVAKSVPAEDYLTGIILEARSYSGERLWQFDTRINIGITRDNNGMHDPAVPWDIDGDGIDEVITEILENKIDYRLVLLDGLTGAIKAQAGEILDSTADRNHYCCVAYLDGQAGPPYIVVCGGIYDGGMVWAYYLDESSMTLKRKWRYVNTVGTSAHELLAYDLNGDGRDEILYGGTALDYDGKELWTITDLEHKHVDGVSPGDLDPLHPGLEVYYHMEHSLPWNENQAAIMVGAEDGELLWRHEHPGDNHHGWAANITDEYPGDECCVIAKDGSWRHIYTAQGEEIDVSVFNEHRPPEWTGDDIYDVELSLLTWGRDGFNYGADVGGGSDHGAEELILWDWGGSTLTVRFNRDAGPYPSRWANRHYRQDVTHNGAGYGGLRCTPKVVEYEPAAVAPQRMLSLPHMNTGINKISGMYSASGKCIYDLMNVPAGFYFFKRPEQEKSRSIKISR